MYVATREIKVVIEGKMVTFQNGDEIPNFEQWDQSAQRANLNLDWVRKEAGSSEPVKPVKTKAPKADVNEGSVKKTEPLIQADFECGACAKKLKTAKALKTHITLAHKKKEE